MNKKALSIRYLLFAAFMLVGLLPMVLMSLSAFYEAKYALTTEIKHDMQTRANATASEVDRMMFERLQNVLSWSQLEIMQDVRVGDVDKRLSNFLRELKMSYRDVYHALYVVDMQGRIVAASDPQKIGQIYTFTPDWLTASMSQRDVNLMQVEHKVLPITAHIQDLLENQVMGQLVVEFNWQQMLDVLNSAVSGRNSATLFDQTGHIIAASALDIQSVDDDADSAMIKVSAAANGGYQGFGWRLQIAQHKSEVMAPVRRMTKMFIGLLLASIVLAIVIGMPVARSITNPLAKLTQFANSFIRSPSQVPPPVGGPAEVRDMSAAFAKMIEDLAQSKEALTRAAKLAVAGEMAAAMSHEVRTPLGILRSSAQILMREPNLSQEGVEVCGFIMSETDRLNKLVNTLIDSARPRLPVYSETDLTKLVEQAVSMMRMQADKKSISIVYDKPNALYAACDAEQITQVLFNLLLNAIQVLPEGGQVTLTIKPQGDYVELAVTDNGPGISVETQSQIFEPFFTQREGGIGLGLAVVRQIVEAHQGRISVHNVANIHQSQGMHGAEFRVQLPLFGVKQA
jgi:two-component system sensor histidine kinase HydH